MSQLPPFSRPGTVRAASPATLSHDESPIIVAQWPSFPSIAPLGLGKQASGRVAMCLTSVFSLSVPSSATSAASRSFHISRSSCDGAVPMSPGWIRPGKRTPGMLREQQ